MPPTTGVADLNLDQPVFHATFGYGTVTGIDDDNITFSSKTDQAVSHTVKALELLTRPQAEVGLETCYFSGGTKAWRRAAGRWASLYKNLCLMEGKGTYGDWLKLHDVSRSSMDDLIRRFEDEATWATQDLVLTESGNTDQTNPEPEMATSIYSVTGTRRDNERTPDPENEARQKNIAAETSKRKNVKPTYHKTRQTLWRGMKLLELFAVCRGFKMVGERIPGKHGFICEFDLQLYVWTNTYSPSGHQFLQSGERR